MTIGEFLKIKRKEKGLSLRQVAYKINVSHTNVADTEKGIIKKESTILKIMSALNLTPEEKEEALRLLIEEIAPKDLQNEMLALKKGLVIQNNSNMGNITVGSNIKISPNTNNLILNLDGLTDEQIEEVKKYIEFLKVQNKIKGK